VKKELGIKIVPEPNWADLWSSLKDRFPDKSVFVPFITRVVIAWNERLLVRLGNEDNADWTEELLTTIGAVRGQVRLIVEVCSWHLFFQLYPDVLACCLLQMAAPNVKRPGTKWDKQKQLFVLTIPNSDPASQAQLVPSLDKDFENLFTDESQEDEWDHIEQTTPAGSGATATIIAGETAVPIQIQVHSQPPPPTHIPTVDRLPPVDALSRPTTLFPSTAPYILMMTLGQGNEHYIRVDCSHEPSLQLLATYLQKWHKTSPNDSMKVCIISSNQPPSLTDRCPFSDPYSLFNSKNLTGAWDTQILW
jgi:hypothetical protein